MAWLRTAWLEALVAVTAAGIVWTELVVWAATARHPDPALTWLAGALLLAAAAKAGWHIASGWPSSSSPSSPSPPSSAPSRWPADDGG